MKRIMAICTGNICRSAMAGIVLSTAAKRLGIDSQVLVDSSGISSEEQGNPMDRRAVQVLQRRGYDVSDPLVSGHRARKITTHEVSSFDILLPMTHTHARALIERFGADSHKVYMWRYFETADNATRAQGTSDQSNHVHRNAGAGPYLGEDLADPWYSDMDDFELALDQLEKSADKILQFALK